ncbi:MAG: hypothetical protein K2X87_34085 [Gemmataceae bacterium]|nr:hypothetical protein [Gemmataceae bacterium]
MPSPPANVFARLHKWAWRQDENFLTEALAVVLENFLVLAPAVGARLVTRLTGGVIDLPAGSAGRVAVATQVEAGAGRPDLEISTPEQLVWIEVTAESTLRVGQLEGYRVLLGESGVGQTRLVLLTRHPEEYRTEEARPDAEVRWFELADWLGDELPAAEAAGEVPGFLVRQFLDFLEGRGMTLAQVGKYMPEGLRALTNLMNMLVEAAAACRVPPKRAPAWDSLGLKLDGDRYWVGVNFEEPEKLGFGTRGRINRDSAVALGIGELTEEAWVPGQLRWWRGVELDSEPVHFYSRSKISQMRWLEGFLRECLDQARSIEVPDQPPPADDPAASGS